MSMDLHSRIEKDELKDTDRFEFLKNGVRKQVIRMDEVHPSDDNDSHYLFLIWVDPEKDHSIRTAIQRNLKGSDLDREWHAEILPATGEGLIIISTWI